MTGEVDDVKKEYLKILLQQYRDSWESIRDCANMVWQMPMLLITCISVLGIAYAQPALNQNQTARILILSLGFGFTLVSLLALIKHRLLSNLRVEDFENIQRQLRTLLEQKEFKALLDQHNIEFREIKFKSKEMAEGHCRIYRTSAYKWQLGLILIILFGIVLLLVREFVLVIIHA